MNKALLFYFSLLLLLRGRLAAQFCADVIDSVNEMLGSKLSLGCAQISSLGEGSTGATFKLKDDHGQLYACKIVDFLKEEGHEKRVLKRFKREVEVLRAVSHPNVVHLYFAEATETRGIELLEFAQDGTLASFIRKKANEEKKRKRFFATTKFETSHLKEVLSIFREILMGVLAIRNAGFVHADLKSINVVMKDGKPLIIDFDQAVPVDKLTSKRGTPYYMDPRMLESPEGPFKFDEFIDVHALGVIFYELFYHGRRPYNGENEEILYPDIVGGQIFIESETDWQAAFIIHSTLAHHQADRPTIQELLTFVEWLLNSHENIPKVKLMAHTLDARVRADSTNYLPLLSDDLPPPKVYMEKHSIITWETPAREERLDRPPRAHTSMEKDWGKRRVAQIFEKARLSSEESSAKKKTTTTSTEGPEVIAINNVEDLVNKLPNNCWPLCKNPTEQKGPEGAPKERVSMSPGRAKNSGENIPKPEIGGNHFRIGPARSGSSWGRFARFKAVSPPDFDLKDFIDEKKENFALNPPVRSGRAPVEVALKKKSSRDEQGLPGQTRGNQKPPRPLPRNNIRKYAPIKPVTIIKEERRLLRRLALGPFGAKLGSAPSVAQNGLSLLLVVAVLLILGQTVKTWVKKRRDQIDCSQSLNSLHEESTEQNRESSRPNEVRN